MPLKDLEVPRSKVKMIIKMGSGQFGEVWKSECDFMIYYSKNIVYMIHNIVLSFDEVIL